MTTQPRDIGVIFDMDGVLVDSAEAHFESWRRMSDELGQVLTRERFRTTFGLKNKEFIPVLFGPMPPERIAAIEERKEANYREIINGNVPLCPGAKELVHALHAAGCRLAIGSSGPKANVEMIVEALDAGGIMQALVSGDDVSRGKPDPEVFLTAAARLNLPTYRCVVIEDAPVGIRAAKAAGTKAVAILIHNQPEEFDNPDLLIDAIANLTADAVMRLVQQ